MNKLFYTLFLLSFLSCDNQNKEGSINPTLTDITESVYASIKIVPSQAYFAQPITSGIIKEILVKEGDEVKKGQKLFQISIPASAENRLSTAELNLQEAKANYEGTNNLLINIETEILSLKQQVSLDSTNFKQQERLWEQKIGKKNDFDRAKLIYSNSKNQLKILTQKKVQTLLNLKNNYKKAQNNTKAEYSQVKDYTVFSEINGVVYNLNKEVGDFISSQERFAEIGTSNDFIINMDIDEVDITKIKLKDTVIIILDAYPEKTFVAKVQKIYPKKEESTQTFRVESVFEPPIPKLFYGLSGEANILVDKRKNTLVIPSEYLMADNKVLTTNGTITVKVGVKNLKSVEILSGLDTTSTLLKPKE